eukprot:gene9081-biopygen324
MKENEGYIKSGAGSVPCGLQSLPAHPPHHSQRTGSSGGPPFSRLRLDSRGRGPPPHSNKSTEQINQPGRVFRSPGVGPLAQPCYVINRAGAAGLACAPRSSSAATLSTALALQRQGG